MIDKLNTQYYYIAKDKLTNKWDVFGEVIKYGKKTIYTIGTYQTKRGTMWVCTNLTNKLNKI